MSFLNKIFGQKGKARLLTKLPGLSVEGCCFIPSKDIIAVSSLGGEIQIIDYAQNLVLKTLEGKVEHPGTMAVSKNGVGLVVLDLGRDWRGGNGEKIEVWDINASNILFETEMERTSASVALSPDCDLLAVGGKYDPIIKLYELATGESSLELDGHGNTLVKAPMFHGRGCLKHLAFSPNGQYLVSGADDGRGILWDLKAPKGYKIIKHDYTLKRVCISHSGNTFATGGSENWLDRKRPSLVAISELSTDLSERAKPIVFNIGAKGRVEALAYTLDDKRILVADSENKLWLWSGASEAKLVKQDIGSILALSQDATKVMAEKDNTITIWDVS